jgi:hypothetical protein
MARRLRIVYRAISSRLIYKARMSLGDQVRQPSASSVNSELLAPFCRARADQVPTKKNAPYLGAFRESDLSA